MGSHDRDDLSIRKLILAITLMFTMIVSIVPTISMVAAQNSTSSETGSSNSTSTSEASTASNSTSSESSGNQTSHSSTENSTSTSQEQYENATGSSQNMTSTETAPITNQTGTGSDAPLDTGAPIPRLSNVTINGEPLVPQNQSLTRSVSYPSLVFAGDVISEVEFTLTWNTNGTTDVKDNRGNQFSLAVPKSQGTVALFANSTVVDQRIAGVGLLYDIYWSPIKNSQGFVDKCEFVMAGFAENATSLEMSIVNSEEAEHAIVRSDRFALGGDSELVEPGISESDKSEDSGGLALDWSDAIKSGYEATFDSEYSTLVIPVDSGPFFVDPYIVTTASNSQSPSKTFAFQDQLRLITTSNSTVSRINAFYYDGSNIVYRTSDNEGENWSSPVSLSTGAIASSVNRWTITPSTSTDGDQYVHLFYWTKSGSTTTIKTKRGDINGVSITWGSPVTISTITSNDSCNPGACVSAMATSNIDGTIYAAFAWNTTSGSYSLVIKKSSDGGASWSDSLSQINGITTNTLAMSLSQLDTPKMLFVYAKNENANLFYRVFNGSSWGSEQNLSSNGMQSNTRKQLSTIYYESDSKAYVAYTNVTTSNGGILKIARFFGNGTFDGLETADNTLRHYLPNIMSTENGDISINSIASGKIHNTRKFAGTWESPANPYGTSFNNPDELTATIVMHGESAAFWKEGTSAPYNLVFDLLHKGLVEPSTSAQNSPGYSDYFEGERRVASNVNGTLFAFYYDGSNIVYRKSFDAGHSWSGTATSTGSGTIASDAFRWTITHVLYNGTDRIVLLYYSVSGSNTNFYQKTFDALDSGLVEVATVNSFSSANDATCSPTGVCGAAARSSDSNATIFAAYRWKSGGTWHYKILKSADGGSTWSTSLATVDLTSTSNRFPIAMTNLNSTRMIFAYTTYETSNLYYRIFDGSSWGSASTITASITANTVKQISSGTAKSGLANGMVTAYVSFLAGGNQGTLKLAVFSSNGGFLGLETADNTLVHWLPSISVTNDGTVHVYSLYNNIIYDTKKVQVQGTNFGFELVNAGIDYAPSAYWQFENDTLDYSGNANNGTAYGNSTSVDGLLGKAIDLDGVDDYVRVKDSSSLDITGNLTISAWVYLDQQTNDFRAIVRKGGAYALEKNNNNIPRFTIWSGGASTPVVLGANALQTNKWYHIVGTYDGSYLRMYVNGVLEGTQARSGTISTNNNDLYIGSTNTTSQFINAKLDDVLIYNRALNVEEIKSLGTEWDLRGASLNVGNPIVGEIDLVRPGNGDTRSKPVAATAGKLYTLETDVIVTSGFAKIDLDFLDSNGGWLTNNTSPSSGVSATSTGGSIQHLAASWSAPANTASMIVRLIDNASGGSARFDNVQLTKWESPSTPYGTDFYYPDQLTAQIAGFDQIGVMWRAGSASPYEIFYDGEVSGEVDASSYLTSPTSSNYYEGEKRVIRTPSALFAFYYDGSDIVYSYSTNDGSSWNGVLSTGTGKINSDYYRWTIVGSTSGTTKYITILYYKKSGTSTEFYAKRGIISGSVIAWDNPAQPKIFSVPNNVNCGSGNGACASAVAATDSNGYIFAAFSWLQSGAITYRYQIFKSTNNGYSWSNSTSWTDSSSSYRIVPALTKLSSGKMLFAYLRYDSSLIYYRTYSGSSWSNVPPYTIGSTGMGQYTVKQISAASDSSGNAYLAYVLGGTSGELWVQPFSGSGSVQTKEKVDGSRSHSLPSITIRPNNKIDIYTKAAGKVFKTDKINGHWTAPVRPYAEGPGVSSPGINQLTVGLGLGGEFAPALWVEGSAPYSIRENGIAGAIQIAVDCPDLVGIDFFDCTEFGQSPYGAWDSITADIWWRRANYGDGCDFYPMIRTDYRLEFPTNTNAIVLGKTFYMLIGWHHGHYTADIVGWRLLPALFLGGISDFASKHFDETCVLAPYAQGEPLIYENHMYYVNGFQRREVVFSTELIKGYQYPPT